MKNDGSEFDTFIHNSTIIPHQLISLNKQKLNLKTQQSQFKLTISFF